MKTHLTGIALFAATVSAVTFCPTVQNYAGANTFPTAVVGTAPPKVPSIAEPRPQIELVFALDTTSSMGGVIEAAKEKIWSIASTMASGQPSPEIKIGLVAFRDRGDDYVTQVTDLSGDLDSVYAKLMDFKAEGGGDGPEAVNEALYDAVHKVTWSTSKNAYKVIFLVGDAVTVATPFDENLAALSRELDETRLYFGNASDKAEQTLKQAATKKLHSLASLASRAR
ncbi:MAG: Mg-chelatase subunit ChlD [Gammaproteobacteria bacterium]|jgi:Mg-chelatase subunit ChlD